MPIETGDVTVAEFRADWGWPGWMVRSPRRGRQRFHAVVRRVPGVLTSCGWSSVGGLLLSPGDHREDAALVCTVCVTKIRTHGPEPGLEPPK